MPVLQAEPRRLDRLEAWFANSTVDIAVQFRVQETGDLSEVFGGRWHKIEERYLTAWELQYDQHLAALDPESYGQLAFAPSLIVISRKQAELVLDLKTSLILGLGSRRGGKSRGSAAKVVAMLARYPGQLGEIISPTYPKSAIMWRYVKRMIPAHWIESATKFDMVIKLWSGAAVKFLSAHIADSLIGEGVTWIGIDEAQSISEEAWALLMPAASDGGTHFQIWQVGTPRPGVFKARYEAISSLPAKLAKILRFTFKDNPFIKTGAGTVFDIAARVLDPRKRKQELDAEFVAEEGEVYYQFSPAIHGRKWSEHTRWCTDITEEYCSLRFGQPYRCVIGVDYGVGRQFAVVYKVVKINHTGDIAMFAVDEVAMWERSSSEDLGRELIKRHHWPAAVCDDAYGPKCKVGEHAAVRLDSLRAKVTSFGDELCRKGGSYAFEVFNHKHNPHVSDRLDAVNTLMNQSNPRYFYDPEYCVDLPWCLENQELKAGKPQRSDLKSGRTLHDLPDAAGYPVIYLFPAQQDYEGLEEAA